ncbi:MAG: hypothetical protein PVH41_05850 [Anaerolineae bacterium]
MMKHNHHLSMRPVVVPAVVVLLLSGLLYGDALTLPLFSDDVVQIPWLESMSLRDLWTSRSPYGYYRPLWYSLWRVWGAVVGGLHPRGLHLLNLVAHAAAAWLTGLLAIQWLRPGSSETERVAAAGLSSALFVAFPFSRQAVAWPGAVYNPLVSAMAAAAVLAYDLARRGGGWRGVGVSLLLAALAPFLYESGLLVALLLLLVELIGRLSGRWRTPARWPWAFALLVVATFTFWRAMRGAGVVSFGLTPGDLWHNLAYTVQGLVFPVAPIAQVIVASTAASPVLALWVVALPAAALLTWSAVGRNLEASLLGLAWFGLFAIPPLVSMKAEWFALAPRFLYMTATGVSLVWTAALSGLGRVEDGRRRIVLIGLASGLVFVPAGAFIRQGMGLYQLAGASIWDAAEAGRSHSVLLVNLPSRITPTQRQYPLGFEGITPLPQRVSADGLVYVHTGLQGRAEAAAFGIVATDQPVNYRYRLFGQTVGWTEMAEAARHAEKVYLTRYESNAIRLVEAGAIDGQTVSGGPYVLFGDRLELLESSVSCGRSGQVTLRTRWRSRSTIGTDASVFAHLLRADGVKVSQADGRALLGMLPFWLWEPQETVRDVRCFDAVASGSYTVRLGVWEPASGQRWPAAGYPDGVVTLPVRCP